VFYQEMADRLLLLVTEAPEIPEVVCMADSTDDCYGFRHMKDYSGRMANPKNKRFSKDGTHLGLFDITVFTGRRYAGEFLLDFVRRRLRRGRRRVPLRLGRIGTRQRQ